MGLMVSLRVLILTLNPKPETPNLKPESLNPEPETLNRKRPDVRVLDCLVDLHGGLQEHLHDPGLRWFAAATLIGFRVLFLGFRV